MSIAKMPKIRRNEKRLFAWVPPEIHSEIKIRAINKNQTMEDFLVAFLKQHFGKTSRG